MNLEKNWKSFEKFFTESRYVRWILFLIVISFFYLICYPNLISSYHEYRIGDVAESDIKAPRDFLVEDKEATLLRKRQAVDEVMTVYDFDGSLAPRICEQVQNAFDELRAIYETETTDSDSNEPIGETSDAADPKVTNRELIWKLKENFEKKLGISVSNGAFSILEAEKFSKDIPDLITRILTEILENGVVASKEVMLKEIEKGIILRSVGNKSERVVYNLKSFYSLDQAKTMVRIIGQPLLKDLNYNLANLIVDFTQRLIQPNITLNRNETEVRKEKASSEVQPVFYKIKSGEMLLREGERVSEIQLLKLNALHAQKNQEHIFGKSIGALMVFACVIFIHYYLYINRPNQSKQNLNKDLLFVSTILIAFLLLTKICLSLFESVSQNPPYLLSVTTLIFSIPIPAAAMTVCLFLGMNVAITFSLVMVAGVTMILQNRFEFFIYFLISSFMAAYWLQHCKERKVFIRAGATLGCLNIVLATVVMLYTGQKLDMNLIWTVILAFLGGIGSGILTAGIVPLVELLFHYTTDITLLELANLERPILRRLMLEAPGTYHHSVIVGSMVEAAAAEIGANPLVAKVCGYYHDIGKINKPLYFIENQTSCENKHDKLAPSMSSLILLSHVKEGVELAKKYKLPQIIIDTIQQHHGTSLIKYFYEKAKILKGEESVTIDDYRYLGPKPQTREAGLVMLADVVEAASRTLENPTPARIQGHVQKLINSIFLDGQLDNCELTLKDLHKIAKCFNKILNGIHHHRIEYLDNAMPINGKDKKDKNGRLDNQPPKQPIDISKRRSESSQDHIKRLGIP